MAISDDEQAKLQRFFATGHLFQRSSFGAQLDKAAANRPAKGAKRKYGPKRPWFWNPPSARGVTLDPQIEVKSVQSEAGNGHRTIPDDDLLLHAEVSRRMVALYRAGAPGPHRSKSARTSYVVLACYYGERGARWAAASQDRFFGDGAKRELAYTGIGPGVIAALFPLTPAGQELLRRERLATTRASLTSVPTPEQKARTKAGKLAIREAIDLRQKAVLHHRAQIEGTEAAIAWMTKEAKKLHAEKRPGRQSVYNRIERARRRAEALLFSVTAETRNIEILRTSGVGALYKNPVPDPSTDEAIDAYELEVAAWKLACAPVLEKHARALEEHAEERRAYDTHKLGLNVGPRLRNGSFFSPGCAPQHPGDPPELSDKKLPAAPVPKLPQAKLFSSPLRPDHHELTDDDQLQVALLIHVSRPTSERGHLIALAHLQSTSLLTQAWNDWAVTAAPAPAPRRHPNAHKINVSQGGTLLRRDSWGPKKNRSTGPLDFDDLVAAQQLQHRPTFALAPQEVA